MLENISLEKILFLDIETVSQKSSFDQLDDDFKKLWTKKSKYLIKDDDSTAESIYSSSAIYAEFGKIVCISCAVCDKEEIKVKSYYSHKEKELLEDFAQMLNKNNNYILCAHNGKEFDFPYIARRMLINGVKLPNLLDIAGKKPWEIQHLDTMELWKFGDYKHYTSLELLSKIFGIPTPKDDINGSEVGGVYWNDNDLDRIVVYCEKDTITIAKLLAAYKGITLKD